MQIVPNQIIFKADSPLNHVNLKPENIGATVFLVPDRSWMRMIAGHFDEILSELDDQAYPSRTGMKNGNKITVIVTGTGADNIDIIINELDALVNFKPETGTLNETLTKLSIIHLGIAHAIQDNLAPGSIVLNTMAIGFDNLMHFYDIDQNLSELTLSQELMEYFETRSEIMLFPYASEGDTNAIKDAKPEFQRCITVCSPGFYAPQSRKIRLPLAEAKMIELLKKFKFEGKVVSSYSSDTAPVMALSKALHHQVISYSIIVSNLITNEIQENNDVLKDKLISAVI